ncbi:MAG TPA: 50S ribosomal protein L5 [Bacteroidota bacterium]|nr:50S ribosomal protein L5 [Bacteroidota bacterium]
MAKETKETKEKKEKKPKGDQAPRADKGPQAHAEEKGTTPRLQELFRKSLTRDLMTRFKYRSIMQVPRLEKIAVNVGVGAATQDPKILDTVVKELESIVGQKPVVTKSKKAISNFKLREGMPIGVRVTLRRHKMYEFMDRFVAVAVPRIRDFRGFSDKSFDGRGNYTVGVKEQIIFPEIDVDKVTRVFGMDITFVTTAETDQEAMELLKGLGFPFVKREEQAAA